jgi:soluble lytic murein transglycosylase-like protein
MSRRAVRRGVAILLMVPIGAAAAFAGSIYYQKEKDGTIRLTNAPEGRGYHTYLTTGHYSSSVEVSGEYSNHIRTAASEFGVDPNLVKAVISTESNFDPRAISPKGARGLMQLMPSTASRFGVKDVFDPAQNISGGVRYLRYLLDLFGGDLVLALAAYNAGEKIVQNNQGVPNYRETRDYVDRVLTRYGLPGKGERIRSSKQSGKAPAARSSPIYRTVSGDGALVFSDSPIPKPVQD